MEISDKVQEAEFDINKNLIIRYKKGAGFYFLKKVNEQWESHTKSFCANPLAIGFKEQYGFGFKDIKPFLFETFDSCLKASRSSKEQPYWEYNQSTHLKYGSTIMRKENLEKTLRTILKGFLK